MNYGKTFMWVNVKVREKRREKTLMEELKTFQLKTTLHLPTLLQLYLEQIHSTTPHK